MQTTNPLYGQQVVDEISEDCLFLNVWTPGVENGRRPVMVWFHGGAFMFGAGSRGMQHGAVLAKRGEVVVVTVNYRLGLFGWLRGIDVCGDALPSTGNEGLLDQLAALQWVKDEIAAFGGDPDNVTVFGQSAGAVSLNAMLSRPRSGGLFHRAVLQSGTQLIRPRAAANQVMERILADLQLAPDKAGRLKELSAAQLLELQTRVTPRARGIAYCPVADGVDIPLDPLAAIAAGNSVGMPLLIGTNLEEQRFFARIDPGVDEMSDAELLTRLADAPPNPLDGARFDPAEAVATYRQARSARGESASPSDLWFAIMSDLRFRVPMMRLAEVHPGLVYTYLLTWRSPGWNGRLGAGHTVDVPLVFGTLDDPESQAIVPPGSGADRLSIQMQAAWLAFARGGNPSTPDLPNWEPYSLPRRPTMLLGTICQLEDAPYEPERRFWGTNTVQSELMHPEPTLPGRWQPAH